MFRRKLLIIFLAVIVLCATAGFLYYLPPVHDRLGWRVDELILKARYAINPPEKVVFVPQQAAVLPTPAVYTATPAPTNPPLEAATPDGPTPAPLPSPTDTQVPTPLPLKVSLDKVRYEDQHGRFNYCAPANLAMALSYWGWDGDRDTVGPVIKPDPKDKNVMPYEMADYVLENTDLRADVRVGGDLDTLKRFISAGFPVLVEKGVYLTDLSGIKSWMGHYLVVTGYDESSSEFTAQDSYVGADRQVAYTDMLKGWRAFNYIYMIIYPAEKAAQVKELLGPDADETTNYQNAALKASNEVYGLEGIDQYFAWFNRGTNLDKLQDYAGASGAYDNAFLVYPTIPEAERPWRMLWYQTGPYEAYYYYQRYWDLLNLAETTLSQMQSEKNIEETYYWRGMAKNELGDSAGAIEDFRLALQYHPGFVPAMNALDSLGAEY